MATFRSLSFAAALAALFPLMLSAQTVRIEVKDLDTDKIIGTVEPGGSFTLSEGDRVRLQPANSQMGPIYCAAGNVEVRGRVVSVIRKF